MPGSTFESSFSEIAHTVLRDKVPALMEHLIGFQIIDKDDNESRAVGVFGFKVNNQWFYAPVFFMNGSLKGTELLYIKGQDIFVPMKDNWVAYILSKKPNDLGGPETKDENELDIKVPTFNAFAESPESAKWASVNNNMVDWAKHFMPAYIDGVMAKTASSKAPLNLKESLNNNPELAAPLAEAIQGNTKLAEAILNIYGDFSFLPSVDKVKQAKYKKAEAETVTTDGGTVTAYTNEDVVSAIDSGSSDVFTDKDKEDLMKGEVIIKDTRREDQKSKVYDGDFEKRLQNPSEPGVYNVLNSTGGFDKALVVTNPAVIAEGQAGGVSVVLTSDNKCSINYTNSLFVTASEDANKGFSGDFKEFFDKATDISNVKPNGVYVALSRDGKVTLPFTVDTVDTGDDGTVSVKVYDVGSCISGLSSKLEPTYSPDSYDTVNKGIRLDSYNPEILITPKKLSKPFNTSDNTCVVTKDAKVIKIGTYDRENYGDNVEKFEAGSLISAERYIMQKGAEQVELFTTGSDVVIRSDYSNKRLSKTAAIINLVTKWGLDKADAEAIVKSASRSVSQYWIKAAAPYLDGASAAPGMPEYAQGYDYDAGIPTVGPQTDEVAVDGMQGGDEESILEDPEVQQMLQAAQTGRQDVFDISTVSNLVKAIDVDSIVDSYLPDIIRGMDRVGRILFMFYWHADSFKQRYGRQEIMDLEDSLRNVFKSTGDMVIFLRQKEVSTDYFSESMSLDLGEIA